MVSFEERFEALARLHGAQGIEKLRRAHVLVIGVGGVGSWAAEAMCRSAVGFLHLIDMDTVAVNNTNRQSEALVGTYGCAKVDVLSQRLRLINPDADVKVSCLRVTSENVAQLILPGAFVLECVDDVDAKAAIVCEAKRKGAFVVTSGGAGGRRDSTQIRLADLTQVTGDPLLSKLRYTLRKRHGFPAGSSKRSKPFGIPAAFSSEAMEQGEGGTFGTSMAVTAAMGMAVAGAALSAITKGDKA